MRRHRRALATFLGVLALVLATTQIAQAAAITFFTPRATFVSTTAARCSTTVITATPATGTGVQRSAVVLGAVPAACAGVTGRLLLVRGDGAAVATAVTFTIPATFAGGTVTVPYGTTGNPATFDASQVASAVLTLKTWRMSTTWSFTAPPSGPIEPTVGGVTVTSHAWSPNAGTSFCVTFTITNTTTASVPWVLDVDLAQAPFNIPAGQAVSTNDYNLTSGTTQLQPVVHGTTSSQPVAAPAPYTVTSGHLLLQGAGWQSTRVLAAGQATTATICDYSAPSPGVVAAGPTTYSVASSPSVVSNQLCVTTTVTGLTTATSTGLVPFVGWQATVDWAAAVTTAASSGWITPAQRTQLLTRTLTTWSNTAPSSRNGSYSGTQLTATTYQLVGTDTYNTASIAGGMQLSARSCVVLP